MIIAFLGSQRSGKTLAMANMCKTYYDRGFVVIANFQLDFPFEYFDEAIFSDKNYIESIKKKYNNNKIIFALDEAHHYLDSRRSGKNTKKSLLITQANKLMEEEGHFFYSTQFLHQVDTRLRDNTSMGIHITKMKIENLIYFEWRILKENIKGELKETKLIKIPMNLLNVNIYNRFESIDLSDDYKGVKKNVKEKRKKQGETV